MNEAPATLSKSPGALDQGFRPDPINNLYEQGVDAVQRTRVSRVTHKRHPAGATVHPSFLRGAVVVSVPGHALGVVVEVVTV